MEKSEAKSAVKALYLQSASLAGLEVGPFSPERLADLVEKGFSEVEPHRHPSAVASTLRLIAVTLEIAEAEEDKMLSEKHIDRAGEKVCPIYPFKR